MKKFLYAILGAIIAAIPGYAIGCFCSCNDSTTSSAIATAFGIIGAIIGLICGWSADSEDAERERKAYEKLQEEQAAERRREEQKRLQAQEQQFKDWSDMLGLKFRKIEKNIGPKFNPESIYKEIFSIKDQKSLSERQKKEYSRQLNNHSSYLYNHLRYCLSREMGLGGLGHSAFVADCIAIIEPDNSDIKKVAKLLRDTFKTAMMPLCYISFNSYGDCRFPLDSDEEMRRIASKAEDLLAEFPIIESSIQDSEKDIVQMIIQSINPDLIKNQCLIMWYYAKLKPFDVTNFENARFSYLTFTARYCKDPGIKDDIKAFTFGGKDLKVIALGSVEEVLARIYSKNQIGGAGTVKQEKSYVDFWLEQQIQSKNYEECYILASGLAWMELYEMELDVLRKMVAADVQLPTELQERLGFLESGGTVNIKLYTELPNDKFVFDTSSLEWQSKEFSVFFRKMAMKKTCVDYSMALSKWTKTLPLMSGQKISKNAINNGLKSLVDDYDGEIICKETDAIAINLANVEYPEAMVFSFQSERNRCISVLVSFEKYGRNLNSTLITLFTPDKDVPLDKLEKYCMAIKDNVYVESFKESILQTIDEATKVKPAVYREEDSNEEHPNTEKAKNKIMFDEE